MPEKKQADKVPANKQKGKKVCTCCHNEKKKVDGFYISKSPLFSIDERLPVCKDCIADMCINKETGIINEVELNKTCRKFDKPYYKNDLMSAYEQFEREHGYIKHDDVKKYGRDIIKLYFKNVSMRQCINKSYEESENDNFIHQNTNTDKKKTKEISKVFSDVNNKQLNTTDEKKQKEKKVVWSEQDNQNRTYAIEVVGYDPFDEYPEEGRKFLYNQLSPYLEDDSNVDDAYKLSQILQIIKNNYQIDICDKKMSQLDPLKDADSIKTLSSIKNQLVQSNDKIAKENEISVKNRSDKAAGKSTLTYLMRDLREKDFDRAEADYYDQLISKGTRWAVDMSITSIKQNGMFDENDKKEIYEIQLELIDSLNQQVDEMKEKVRLLLIENDRLKAGVADGI